MDIESFEKSNPIELKRDKSAKAYVSHFTESRYEFLMKHSNRNSDESFEDLMNSQDELDFMDFYVKNRF